MDASTNGSADGSTDGTHGRVALVTGGGSGIGRAVALRLARDGLAVAVAGRDLSKVAATALAIEAGGGRAVAVSMDVTDPDAVRRGVADVTARLGAPSVLVNNAGIATSKKFGELTVADWERTFAVNVIGAFVVTQACLPGMTSAGWGRVVMVGSTAAVQGFPYVAHYVASKHALLGMARSLALEFAAKGVTVNCVCPGYVDTDMTQRTLANIAQATGRTIDEARRSLEAQSPQRRLMTPGEVADTIAHLCGEGAAGINGQAIVVNGG